MTEYLRIMKKTKERCQKMIEDVSNHGRLIQAAEHFRYRLMEHMRGRENYNPTEVTIEMYHSSWFGFNKLEINVHMGKHCTLKDIFCALDESIWSYDFIRITKESFDQDYPRIVATDVDNKGTEMEISLYLAYEGACRLIKTPIKTETRVYHEYKYKLECAS